MTGLYLFATAFKQSLETTQPLSRWVPGAFNPEVKPPGREVDCLLKFSAEVQDKWSFIPLPQYVFMASCLIKQQICLRGVVLS
jgi:hypothetical protein